MVHQLGHYLIVVHIIVKKKKKLEFTYFWIENITWTTNNYSSNHAENTKLESQIIYYYVYIYCIWGWPDLDLEWVILVPNGTVHKTGIWKSPGFVPFRANLTLMNLIQKLMYSLAGGCRERNEVNNQSNII